MTNNPAVVASAYGEPDVLTLIAAERPTPGPGQVLIEVRAGGINPLDYKLYSGMMGNDPAALPMRLGLEVSGVVAEIGPEQPESDALAVGDAVLADRVKGGYAAYVVADRGDVFAKPETLSFEEASGLLVVGATAVDLLTATDVTAGDTVLVHGASGGVGSLVVQLAVARGARVIGTAGAHRHDEVRQLEGDLLDLEPLVRDAVVLELPFQPLCSDDCPGLCPECGARLADNPDHAHDAATDPRWAGLVALQQDED